MWINDVLSQLSPQPLFSTIAAATSLFPISCFHLSIMSILVVYVVIPAVACGVLVPNLVLHGDFGAHFLRAHKMAVGRTRAGVAVIVSGIVARPALVDEVSTSQPALTGSVIRIMAAHALAVAAAERAIRFTLDGVHWTLQVASVHGTRPVSYTHLTLPTILLV